ncbi:MAG: hypothetical protein ACE5MG_07800 [Candidatus Methylomirabilales bacterium]
MNEYTMETLVIKLERLERENRQLKRAGAVALAGIVALVLMGQTTSGEVAKVVEAKEFVLRDAKGDMRAVLALGPDGSVGLGLSDATGTARAWLSLGPQGSPSFALFDRAARPRATLRLWPDGVPRLALNDQKGNVIWSAP